MKSKGKVRQKIKDAKFKYLKRELRDKLKACPQNCQYNERHRLTTYKRDPVTNEMRSHETEIGLCMYGADNPEEWPGKICDEEKTAQECGLFLGRYDKEQVKEAFNAKLEDPQVVAHEYKDIAALQWVVEEDASAYSLSWYQRLVLWMFCKTLLMTGLVAGLVL